jgi:hypothetical protein
VTHRSRGGETERHERERKLLEGNGANLVRERALAARVQRDLARLYQLESACDVAAFLAPAEDGEREALLVREAEDGALEMLLRVPRLDERLDSVCQLIEGVSHFVYVAERAREGRETTQLELELQAEVDKYVVLAASLTAFDAAKSAALRARLYDAVSFAHDAESDAGERYRVANDLAQRYVRHLEHAYVARARYADMRRALQAFHRMGQEEKLRAARAA